MRPRSFLWLILLLTAIAIFINIPNQFNKQLHFRKGLDLEGGTSMTLKAEMKDIPPNQRDKALDSTKLVIERRINIFGVSEPVIQIAKGEDYRVIVELPGVALEQARQLVGTTAQLSFWEQKSDKISTNAATLQENFRKTDLSGKDLKDTNVVFDPNTGKPQVQLTFTSEGSQKFAEITKRNVGKVVAIVLDNQVIEMPRVNEPILTGNAVITGNFTIDLAKQLSTELNGGALPVPLTLLQSKVVEPTLGLDSLKKSLFAGGLGFLIVVLFIVFSYKKLGILASIALSLYVLFVLSIFKISSVTPYGITLALSGIAGFILSIGMAVDANILIFERMKEEERSGKSKETSINLGFSRAFPSIRDSNISTLITSTVLYEFGTGPVKGFALVLTIGVLVSMFSAIVVTRTLLRLIYK